MSDLGWSLGKLIFRPILPIWLFWKSLTWLVYQILGDFGRKLNFVRILCIWLFWKTLTWLVYQISGDFGRILNFVRILSIWLFWKTLTWLVYIKFWVILGGNSIFIRILSIWLFWKTLTWLVYQISGHFWGKLFFRPILCIWLFWKTLIWLVYQILDDFWGKLFLGPIFCIWLFWKTLTWLVCQKGLTFFKSPWNVSPRSAFRGLWKSEKNTFRVSRNRNKVIKAHPFKMQSCQFWDPKNHFHHLGSLNWQC